MNDLFSKSNEAWLNEVRLKTIYLVGLFWAFYQSGTFQAFWQPYLSPKLMQSSCANPSADPVPSSYPSIYSTILTKMSNDASSQVRIVDIKADLLDIQQNICRGRDYLTDLVQAINTQRPAVLVIDKYFGPNTCAGEPQSTGRLIKAIQSLKIPVIIGESTDTANVQADDNCLVRTEQLDFHSTNVHHGLLKLNVNREQVPLQWSVLPRQPPDTNLQGRPSETLSLVASRLAAADLAGSHQFQSLLSDARQPYARLNPDPPQESSTDVLCSAGSPDARKRWSLTCQGSQHHNFDLLGKVVIIGAENEADHWVVLGRRMWGFELQAHYIDALLSGHYLRSMSGAVILACYLGFLALASVPWLLERIRYSREKWRFVDLCERQGQWIFPPLFVLVVSCCFLANGYLPPIQMLYTILTTYFASFMMVKFPTELARNQSSDSKAQEKAMGAGA